MADSLVFVDPSLPFLFDNGLLAALDNGINADSPAALVVNYLFNWWNCQEKSSPDELLSKDNIFLALKHHWKQHIYTSNVPVPTTPILISTVDTECDKCPQYHDIASGAVAELERLFRFTEAAETSVQNSWEINIQRAHSLYILHQAVLDKEVSSTDLTPILQPAPSAGPSKVGDVRIHRKSQHMFNQATAKL